MMRQILLFKIMVMVAFSKNGCKGTKKSATQALPELRKSSSSITLIRRFQSLLAAFSSPALLFFSHHQPPFRHHCRRAADEDIAVGLDACVNDRWTPHRLALDETALRFCAEASTLLQVIGQ